MNFAVVTFRVAVLALRVRKAVFALTHVFAGVTLALYHNLATVGIAGHLALCLVGSAHANTTEAAVNFTSILVPLFFIFELIDNQNDKREIKRLLEKLDKKG